MDSSDDDPCLPPDSSSSSFPTFAVLHLLRFSSPASDSSSTTCCDDRSSPTSNKLSSILHPSPLKKPSLPPPPSRRTPAVTERIVQTDVATFREVVHRLTGASPAESSPGARLHQDTTSKKMIGDGKNRNRGRLSILQRRKSSKKLHHLLLTAAPAQPPVVHSPVSPLSLSSPITPISSDEDKLGSLSSAIGKPATEKCGESMKEGNEEKGFFFCQLRGSRPISRPTLLRLFPESPTAEAATQWEEEEEEEEEMEQL